MLSKIEINNLGLADFGINRFFDRSRVIRDKRPQIPETLKNTAYESLLRRCWSQDPEERPNFVDELENNEGFINDTVDENEYVDYVDYLNEYSSTFDPSKRIELTQMFLQKSKKSHKFEGKSDQRNSTQNDQHHFNELSNNGVERNGEENRVQD